MGLFAKKKQLDTPIVVPPTPQEFLEKRLREDVVEYTVEGGPFDRSMTVAYRGPDVPCLRIEVTQLFSNPNCVYTYHRKEWRENRFPHGGLGYIDASVTDNYEVCLSAMAPGGNILDENVLRQRMDRIQALLISGVDLFSRSKCLKDVKYPNTRSGECPYIIFGGENSGFTYSVKPGARSAEFVCSMVQLFALAIHRSFGVVYKPVAEFESTHAMR